MPNQSVWREDYPLNGATVRAGQTFTTAKDSIPCESETHRLEIYHVYSCDHTTGPLYKGFKFVVSGAHGCSSSIGDVTKGEDQVAYDQAVQAGKIELRAEERRLAESMEQLRVREDERSEGSQGYQLVVTTVRDLLARVNDEVLAGGGEFKIIRLQQLSAGLQEELVKFIDPAVIAMARRGSSEIRDVQSFLRAF